MKRHTRLEYFTEMFVIPEGVVPVACFGVPDIVPPVWIRVKMESTTPFASEIKIADDNMMRVPNHINRNAVHE